MSNSDGDTSSLRKVITPITEKTPVVVPLGAVIAGILLLLGLAGTWALWVTVTLQDVKQDIAVVKAAVGHADSVASK